MHHLTENLSLPDDFLLPSAQEDLLENRRMLLEALAYYEQCILFL